MFNDIMKLVDKLVNIFKKPLYGRTFYCPVCHIELSFHDVDEHGNMVCPVCGVVIELNETYGHAIPVVNDVEILRAQPKKRLHPVATHLPIGLYPFALLGAMVVLLFSILIKITGEASVTGELFASISPVIESVSLIFLIIAVASSALTFLTGFLDWRSRYGGRPYRVITLKIILSAVFLVLGILVVALHFVVFQYGVIAFSSFLNVLAAVSYYALFSISMFILASLGHVGGYLVFGK